MTRSVGHRDRVLAILSPAALAAVIVALWQLAVAASGTAVFPSPLRVAQALGELQDRGLLVPYALDSIGRVSAGFLLAVVLGTPLGIYLGLHPRVASAIDPVVQLLRPISPLAWLPIAVVLLGVGNAPAVFLIFLASLFPIVVSAATAVVGTREVHLRVARNFGLPHGKVLFRVLLPSALPQTMVGYRLTLGIAWLVVVAAEMLAVDSGLGYLVIDSRNAGQRYDLVVAAMLVIGIIGLLLDFGMRRLERATTGRWSQAG